MQIRPFQPGDTSAVCNLIAAIQRGEFDIPITLHAQPDLTDIRGFYQRGCGNFWIAEERGEIVGTLGLLDIGDGAAALRKMFVAATHRGKEHGVAQRLLETLVAWCGERDLSRIYLGTTARFLAAHRFYEKNGFLEIDRPALPAAFPVMSVDTRFYRLEMAQTAT